MLLTVVCQTFLVLRTAFCTRHTRVAASFHPRWQFCIETLVSPFMTHSISFMCSKYDFSAENGGLCRRPQNCQTFLSAAFLARVSPFSRFGEWDRAIDAIAICSSNMSESGGVVVDFGHGFHTQAVVFIGVAIREGFWPGNLVLK